MCLFQYVFFLSHSFLDNNTYKLMWARNYVIKHDRQQPQLEQSQASALSCQTPNQICQNTNNRVWGSLWCTLRNEDLSIVLCQKYNHLQGNMFVNLLTTLILPIHTEVKIVFLIFRRGNIRWKLSPISFPTTHKPLIRNKEANWSRRPCSGRYSASFWQKFVWHLFVLRWTQYSVLPHSPFHSWNHSPQRNI